MTEQQLLELVGELLIAKSREQNGSREKMAQLPLHVPMGNGTIHIVSVPAMTAEGFANFRNLLDLYEGTIACMPAATAEPEGG